jgi:hypothetical protein
MEAVLLKMLVVLIMVIRLRNKNINMLKMLVVLIMVIRLRNKNINMLKVPLMK